MATLHSSPFFAILRHSLFVTDSSFFSSSLPSLSSVQFIFLSFLNQCNPRNPWLNFYIFFSFFFRVFRVFRGSLLCAIFCLICSSLFFSLFVLIRVHSWLKFLTSFLSASLILPSALRVFVPSWQHFFAILLLLKTHSFSSTFAENPRKPFILRKLFSAVFRNL